TPGANRARVFGPPADQLGGGLTADDLGARYLAFMALGGTQKNLPLPILDQVSFSPVLGKSRGPQGHVQGTGDMLRLGLSLCAQVLPADPGVLSLKLDNYLKDGRIDWGAQTGLIDTNGDAEMWLRLCAMGNRPVVRVIYGWSSRVGVDAMVITA